jgi:hypothetical protein
MSPEERRLLSDLFDRLQAAQSTERDREADDFIATRLREQPYAVYFLAQAVIVQDQALQATTRRVQELEDELQRRDSQDGGHGQQSGGFLSGLGSLFGNRQPQPPARSYDRYSQRDGSLYDDYAQSSRAPDPGPWGRAGASGPWGQSAPMGAGGGFLSGALTTAAGVAGGVLAADAIRGMFSSHWGGTGNNLGAGLGGFGNGLGGETVVNNFFGNDERSRDPASGSGSTSGGGTASAAGNDRDDPASGGGFADAGNDDDDDDFDVADYDDGGDDSFV